MRRYVRGVALIAAVLVLAGCQRHNLVESWPMPPAADIPPPKAGDCYRSAYSEVWNRDAVTIQCNGGDHSTETAYVGAFDAHDTAAGTPPPNDGPSRQAAFATCGRHAATYIGGDWHLARVALGLVVPGPDDWIAGRRWFRCDLMPTYDGAVFDKPWNSGSLRDVLRTEAKTHLVSCLTLSATGRITDDDCAVPHNAEFAGLFTAAAVAPSDQLVTRGCDGVVAAFLGFTDGVDHNRYVTGAAHDRVDERRWRLGDRVTRCYAVAPAMTFTQDLKGLGTARPV